MKNLTAFLLTLLVATTGHAQLTEVDKTQLSVRNLVANPGAEEGKTGHTASAGTFAVTTTSAHVASGRASFSWDGSATGQTVTGRQVTVPSGLFYSNCVAKVRYKSAESTVPYVLEAIDGSLNVLGSVTLSASDYFTDAYAYFVCPASGTVAVRLRTNSSAGDPAIIYWDEEFIGRNYLLAQVGGASLVGSLRQAGAASCTWSTTSGSFGDFSADTDCGSYTVTGAAAGPSTKVPHVELANLPAGNYQIVAMFNAGVNDSGGAVTGTCRLYDGSTQIAVNQLRHEQNDNSRYAVTLNGAVSYSSGASRTIKVQCRTGGGTLSLDNSDTNSELSIFVYRYPSSSELALRMDHSSWKVDATINGATFALGTGAVASYTEMSNGSETLTQNTGSASVGVACSSTNASTVGSTTCSAGNESNGITFVPPYAGDFMVCTSFSWTGSPGASNPSYVYVAFQHVETPSNAQTVLQNGNSRVSANAYTNAAAGTSHTHPLRLCSTMQFASVAQRTVRLMYKQTVSGTVTSSSLLADASTDYADVHWEVYPVSPWRQHPVLMNGVTSNATAGERVERAKINCDASSSIVTQSGTWVSSIGNRSGTGCAITITSGIFSNLPTCVVTREDTTVQAMAAVVASATSLTVYGPSADYDAYLLCMGPK